MTTYRNHLPQLDGGFFLTDGGLETTLVFHRGFDLPEFAAFHIQKDPAGKEALREYFRAYADIATRFGAGLILESATWRASAGWGAKLGYSREALTDVNHKSIEMLEQIKREMDSASTTVVISGALGPRGDGYTPADTMSGKEAEAYHREQIETLARTAADMVCAFTINYTEEAVGIARAAERAAMPVAISFTVETNGALPTGETLQSAIQRVDEATSSYVAYYMINCAHPTHFERMLPGGEPWTRRIRGLRANSSIKSHAELNESCELDTGDPADLASWYVRLKQRLPHLAVFGGCCGTDHRHVEAIAAACRPLFPSAANGGS